jgi:hypothetical protein
MTRIGFSIIFIAMWPGTVGAASQLGPAFEQAKAGKPFEECFRSIDFSKLDLAEETPIVLKLLNGSDPLLARRAAAAVNVVLFLRLDAKTKSDARALVPAISAHYDDPDPEQLPGFDAPTDVWRQAVMRVVAASDAVPPPALLAKMQADLDRKGDLYGSTALVAASALLHLRARPQGLIDTLLAKMDESPQSRIDLIREFGVSHIDDPRVIKKIAAALDSAVPLPANFSPDLAPDQASALRDTNELHRLAASALGQIGRPAASALPALRGIAGSTDPTVDEETRREARQAIGLIDAPR